MSPSAWRPAVSIESSASRASCGLLVDHPLRGAGVQHHDVERVADAVVKLTRHACALLGHSLTGAGLAVGREERGPALGPLDAPPVEAEDHGDYPDERERGPGADRLLPRQVGDGQEDDDEPRRHEEPRSERAAPLVEGDGGERGDDDRPHRRLGQLVPQDGLEAEKHQRDRQTGERRPPEQGQRKGAGHRESGEGGAARRVSTRHGAAREQLHQPRDREDEREDDADRQGVEHAGAPGRRWSSARRRGEDVGWPFHARSIGEVGGGGGNRTRVHGRLGGVSTGLAVAFGLARGPRVGRVPVASPGQSRVRSLGAVRPHPSPLDDTASPGRGRAGCDASPNYLGGECERVILGK